MKYLCFAALLLLPNSVRADEANKHVKVRELFRLTYMENRMDQTKKTAMAQARAYAAQQLALFNLPNDQNSAASDYYERLYALVATKYDWSKLEPAYEQIYVDLYTESELDGILEFYKSPVGQALLAKTPQATTKMLEVSTHQFESLAPQIQKLTEEYVAGLQPKNATGKKK
jgi:hypothetical protein